MFARLGEKKNRARARIKFMVHDLGIEKFKALVLEERDRLPPDPRWKQYLDEALAASGKVSPTAGRRLVRVGVS